MARTVSNAARNPVLITSPRGLLASLFSLEALLLLYSFAGIYKGDPRFGWVPVDLTGLFFALSVVVGAFVLVLGRIYKNGFSIIVAMLGFTAWFALSLVWSPSEVYGPDKVFSMSTLGLWAAIASIMIVAPDPERLRRFCTLVVVFSVWIGIETLLVYGAQGQVMTDLEMGTYLARGRVCGLGAVVVFVAWLFGPRWSLLNVMLVSLFLGMVFVLAIGGGRGPLVATALTLLIPMLVGVRLTRHRILYSRYQPWVLGAVALVVGFFATYTAITGDVPKTFDRFEGMVEGDQFQGSAGARARYFATAVDLWLEAPLIGHGAGSWPVETIGRDVARYPHNLFLEVLVEGGLVGLVLILVLFFTALRPVSPARLRSDPLALCSLMLFAGTFFGAMVSGDLPDNRTMFLLLGLLAVFTMRQPAAKPETTERWSTGLKEPALPVGR